MHFLQDKRPLLAQSLVSAIHFANKQPGWHRVHGKDEWIDQDGRHVPYIFQWVTLTGWVFDKIYICPGTDRRADARDLGDLVFRLAERGAQLVYLED